MTSTFKSCELKKSSEPIFIYNQDILLFDVQVLAHQCNCTSKTGKGLYLEIVNKYPHAAIYSTRKKPSIPGTIKITGNVKGETKVLSMFAQNTPGKPTEKETSKMREKWFQECLDKILNIKNLKSIAFPKNIGCGLACGNWNKYKEMIENFSKKVPNTKVYIVSNEDKSNEDKSQDDTNEGSESNESIILVSDEEIEKSEGNFSEEKIKKFEYEPNTKLSYKDGIANIVENQKDILEYNGWWEFFEEVLADGVLEKIDKTIIKEAKNGQVIFPPPHEVFNAVILTPLKNACVVILGQNPYHNKGAAMGLSFSHHNNHGKIQPSLNNIYKEVENCGYKVDWESGDLRKWSEQGVLLLNSGLTVKEGDANSHLDLWMEKFATLLFQFISRKCEHLVVFLWGAKAQKFDDCFNSHKHFKLKAGHPSPINTSGGFLGTKHFKKANEQLKKWKMEEIDWNLK
jgi:uracil-DNA glycosylase